MKVKVTPIKNDSLCEKCKYNAENNNCGERFCDCEMYDAGVCLCTTLEQGSPCPFFKLSKKGKKK